MLPAHARLYLPSAIWKHWAFKGVVWCFLVKSGESVPRFPMTASTNFMGSLKLQGKYTDTWTVSAKGNKTFLKAPFFSIFSPVKDSGKSATDFNKSRSWNTKIRCKKKRRGGGIKGAYSWSFWVLPQRLGCWMGARADKTLYISSISKDTGQGLQRQRV